MIAVLPPDLSRLVDPSVQFVVRHAAGLPSDLFPEETHYVRRAVAKRVAEFAAGRACARLAMSRLGFPATAIPAAADRSPIWPAGLVGSITHTDGWCAAAVARREDCLAIGIDTELVGAPIDELWPTICGPRELAWVRARPPDEQRAAVTLLFSIKEAFYKCQYPLTQEWLEFHDLTAEVAAFKAHGEFIVRPNRELRAMSYFDGLATGRYAFHERWVSAAITIAAPRGAG